MMQWIIMSMLIIFNFIFMNMKHPLAMGLTILIQTTLVCLMCGILSKSFWFSYILFLVFIGGMLILFIYVTSLASNEMFSLSIKLTMISMIIFFISLSILMLMDKNLLMNYKNYETHKTNELNLYMMENSLSLNKLYNFPSNMLTIMLMIYLLITLIATVKITKLFEGPLRTMFN
uniref:NADH dehydrogenase subunit 6 n=1 Tax=Cylindromyia intermedia TaxID=2250550 RepID=UPI001EDEE131|nr:NADH dehydrogenase subunit 6 [Cylindromyia intermedia]UHY94310.1 NADH dehydrogenase subunit 6 [Cylindromyia intermedia]